MQWSDPEDPDHEMVDDADNVTSEESSDSRIEERHSTGG